MAEQPAPERSEPPPCHHCGAAYQQDDWRRFIHHVPGLRGEPPIALLQHRRPCNAFAYEPAVRQINP